MFTDGPLRADGDTDSLVQVEVPGLGPDEAVHVNVKGAKVVDQRPGPQGTFFVTLRPDAVDAPAELAMSVKGKGDLDVDATLPIPVAPGPGHPVVTLEPDALDAPKGGVLVHVRPTNERPGERHLAVAASLGQVSPLSPSADGSWTATWAPPADLDRPAAILFTATDLTAPEEAIGWGVLPVEQPVTRKLDADAGATATLVVGGRRIGTAKADAEGLARFDLALRPGDATGELTIQPADAPSRTVTVDLDNPARPAVAFAPLPAGTGVPAGRPVTLWLAVVGADGQPRDRVPELVVQGPNGPVAEPVGEGWYRVVVTAPAAPGPFTVHAALGLAEASLDLKAVPPVPKVSLVPDPRVLGQARQVTLTATWAGGRGGRAADSLALQALGLPNATTTGTEAGAKRVVPLAGLRDVTGIATVSGFAPTGLPPARLQLWPGRAWPGKDTLTPLFVVVEDALGLPVPDQQVALAPDPSLQGLPRTVDTGPEGWAMVTFHRIDDRVEPLPIRATSGSLAATTVLWPHTGSLGTARDALARARWGTALPVVYLTHAGEPLGTAVEPPPPGPPSRVEAVAEAKEAETKQIEAKPKVRRRPARAPTGWVWQAGGGLADVGIRYHQTSRDADIPGSLQFRVPLPFAAAGVFGRAEVWHPSGFGAELFARIGGYKVSITGQTVGDATGAWRLGARYRRWLDDRWGFLAGAGVHRTDVIAFVWDSQRTTALDRSWAITGLRLGGAGLGHFGIVNARAGLWETFAPGPDLTQITLRADVALPVKVDRMGVSITGDFDLDFRHTGHGLDAGDITLKELDGVFLLGATLGNAP